MSVGISRPAAAPASGPEPRKLWSPSLHVTILAIVLLGLIVLAADVIWMARDHSVPSFDQSAYLATAWTEVLAHHLGLHQAYEAIMHTDPSHGPLYELLTAFFMGLIGPKANAGILVDLLALPFLLGSVAGIAHRFGGRRAALWSVVLVVTTPIMIGLSREILEDFLLTAMCAMTLYASFRCDRFNSLPGALFLGVSGGLAILTKVSAPEQIVLPVIVGIAIGMSPASFRRPSRAQLRNLAIAIALFLILTLWWYVPNFSETKAYIQSTQSGTLSIGAGPPHPFALNALESYYSSVLDNFIDWGVFITLIAGLIAAAPGGWRLLTKGPATPRRELLLAIAFFVVWILPAMLYQSVSANQDQREVAAALIGIPVLAGILISFARGPWLKATCATAVAAFSLYPIVTHTVGPNANHIWGSRLGSGYLTANFGNQPIAYEFSPQPINYADPFFKWLLQERAEHDIATPIIVAVLGTNASLNGNSIHWLDLRDGNTTRIETNQPAAGSGLTPTQIRAEFAPDDAVITFSQDSESSQGLRAELLDEGIASAPRYLKPFKGPTVTYPLPGGTATIRWR